MSRNEAKRERSQDRRSGSCGWICSANQDEVSTAGHCAGLEGLGFKAGYQNDFAASNSPIRGSSATLLFKTARFVLRCRSGCGTIAIADPHNHVLHLIAPVPDVAVVGARHGNTDGFTVEPRPDEIDAGWHIDDC